MTDIKSADNLLSQVQNIMTFRVLRTDEVKILIERGSVVSYDPGETIIHQGDHGQTLFGIVEGSVSVTVKEKEKDVYIDTLGTGDVFGEAGIFLNVDRTANIVATDRVTVFAIDRKGLLDFVKINPDGGNRIFLVIIYGLLRKLRSVNQELAFERREDVDQDDIDSLVKNLLP
jgi:CRP/FNR family transcriptional regulator, cyclic AMP receptor protein